MQAIKQIMNSQLGLFCKIGRAAVFKNEFTKPLSGVYFSIDFRYYGYNQSSTIITTNVRNGLYWHLFGILSLSKTCNVGIPKREILRLMKECRLATTKPQP